MVQSIQITEPSLHSQYVAESAPEFQSSGSQPIAISIQLLLITNNVTFILMWSLHWQVAGVICLWVPRVWLGTSKCLWQTRNKEFSFYCLCFLQSLLPVSWDELILIRVKFLVLKRLGTVASFHSMATQGFLNTTSYLTNPSPEGPGKLVDSLVYLIPLSPSILTWEWGLSHPEPASQEISWPRVSPRRVHSTRPCRAVPAVSSQWHRPWNWHNWLEPGWCVTQRLSMGSPKPLRCPSKELGPPRNDENIQGNQMSFIKNSKRR